MVQHAVAAGYDHLLLDGTLIPTDRVHNTGASCDRWYSGKHKHHGGNVQALCNPDGRPIWVSPVEPGATHRSLRSDGGRRRPRGTVAGADADRCCPSRGAKGSEAEEPGRSVAHPVLDLLVVRLPAHRPRSESNAHAGPIIVEQCTGAVISPLGLVPQ